MNYDSYAFHAYAHPTGGKDGCPWCEFERNPPVPVNPAGFLRGLDDVMASITTTSPPQPDPEDYDPEDDDPWSVFEAIEVRDPRKDR